MIRKASLYDDEPYNNERRYKKSNRETKNKVHSLIKETYEKCIILADKSIMMGDRATAEIYYQHAEHYLHLMKRQGVYDL
jgi:hypothetical protein